MSRHATLSLQLAVSTYIAVSAFLALAVSAIIFIHCAVAWIILLPIISYSISFLFSIINIILLLLKTLLHRVLKHTSSNRIDYDKSKDVEL